jgi:hypothetical protein
MVTHLGTLVTTPVPLPMEMVRRGKVYTLGYAALGALSGRPKRSQPRKSRSFTG